MITADVDACGALPTIIPVARREKKESEYGQFSGSVTHPGPRSVKGIFGFTSVFRLHEPRLLIHQLARGEFENSPEAALLGFVAFCVLRPK
jgi:hypothetical protein